MRGQHKAGTKFQMRPMNLNSMGNSAHALAV